MFNLKEKDIFWKKSFIFFILFIIAIPILIIIGINFQRRLENTEVEENLPTLSFDEVLKQFATTTEE